MFDYDWFHGQPFKQHVEDAKWRCARRKFPDIESAKALEDEAVREFLDKVEIRTLVYLRDGFSYEMKDMSEVESKSHLTFECEPIDEHYKVGAFVVSVFYEDVVRVEVFAVHADEKPEDMPMITGFRGATEPSPPREDLRKPRDTRPE